MLHVLTQICVQFILPLICYDYETSEYTTIVLNYK